MNIHIPHNKFDDTKLVSNGPLNHFILYSSQIPKTGITKDSTIKSDRPVPSLSEPKRPKNAEKPSNRANLVQFDCKSELQLTTTLLENNKIVAFSIGGELYLCLPQVLNTVLRDFTLPQITNVSDNLNIYISRCNISQLNCLKSAKVLPAEVPSCGLISKTNAQRLISKLVTTKASKLPKEAISETNNALPVYHECFGKCKGYWHVKLYEHPEASCIECRDCQCLFSPEKFVCHAHEEKGEENKKVCHWGFDASKWRSYILASNGEDTDVKDIEKHLELQRKKFLSEAEDGGNGGNWVTEEKHVVEVKRASPGCPSPNVKAPQRPEGVPINRPPSAPAATHPGLKRSHSRVDYDSGFSSSSPEEPPAPSPRLDPPKPVTTTPQPTPPTRPPLSKPTQFPANAPKPPSPMREPPVLLAVPPANPHLSLPPNTLCPLTLQVSPQGAVQVPAGLKVEHLHHDQMTLQMISQEMEFTIGQLRSQCSPEGTIQLHRLVTLLTKQQMRYIDELNGNSNQLKMKTQECERLMAENRARATELSSTKYSLIQATEFQDSLQRELERDKFNHRVRLHNEMQTIMQHKGLAGGSTHGRIPVATVSPHVPISIPNSHQLVTFENKNFDLDERLYSPLSKKIVRRSPSPCNDGTLVIVDE